MSAKDFWEGMKPQMKPQQLANRLITNTTGTTNVTTAKLCHRYEQLFRSEKYCDCVFRIGGTSLKGHKLILSAASPVFEAMFYGPFCESNAHEIEILDISADVFYTLLSSIYTGRVDFDQLTLEDTIELYYGAEKYLLTELSDDCLLTGIKRKLRFANILPALELCFCMNMQALLEICLSFFTRCCLCDPQYRVYLKHNYLHISKECIKLIIATTEELRHLLWFVAEWCSHECAERREGRSDDCKLGMETKLQLNAVELQDELLRGRARGDDGEEPLTGVCQSLERSYYKACRPFMIDADLHEWRVSVTTDRFISLLGIIIHSRLTPSTPIQMPPLTAMSTALGTEYEENLLIEIRAKKKSCTTHSNSDGDNDEENKENENDLPSDLEGIASDRLLPLLWRYNLKRHPTKYNCDLHIQWKEDIVLSPDIEYQIKLSWQSNAYGAEYPCSLKSNEVDGIKFKDFDAHCGSIIKGLRFLNLV